MICEHDWAFLRQSSYLSLVTEGRIQTYETVVADVFFCKKCFEYHERRLTKEECERYLA